MYIIRCKSTSQVKTFVFNTFEEMELAQDFLIEHFDLYWFSAKVESALATCGEIIHVEYERTRYPSFSSGGEGQFNGQSFTIGTKEEMEKQENEINAQITCWASEHATSWCVAGSMWACRIENPLGENMKFTLENGVAFVPSWIESLIAIGFNEDFAVTCEHDKVMLQTESFNEISYNARTREYYCVHYKGYNNQDSWYECVTFKLSELHENWYNISTLHWQNI